ncbi:hypothetical protein B0H13DRAFT_1850886 [Mycena leptocephala]|nr:hypothetical protein B0H13DRAFT_1850886 [Mycena leptocephala]
MSDENRVKQPTRQKFHRVKQGQNRAKSCRSSKGVSAGLLRLYMNLLPDALPYEQPQDKINNLLSFSLDPDWVESTSEEATGNRELESAFWEFTGGQHNEDGTFKIPTCGPAIEKLADILESLSS